jgi:MFS transporter, DHA1 family, multidrug resistance protein
VLLVYLINKKLEKRKRSLLILILGLLSAIGPFSIDMYLPGFPAIAADLHTTVDKVSYSLASFFIGICVGQLLCGPLLDRFGRKRPLIGGLIIYILASIGCAFSQTVEVLVIFRFFQALGGCVGIVAPRAIVRDLFPVNENARIFSLLILILGVSPIIAPTAGSYIVSTLGWHYVFIALTIISFLILLAVIFFLEESKEPDPSFSLRPKPIISGFTYVMKQPQFYTYALTGAVASAGLYAYLSGSPFVFMELYKVTEQQYGLIFALIASGLITGSQVNNLLLRKHSSQRIVPISLMVQSTAGIVLFALTALGFINLQITIFLIFIYLSCQGFTFPNSSALAMAPFSREAGSASALLGAIQMGLGAVISALVGYINNHTALPMTGVMAACSVSAFLILLIGRRTIEVTSRDEDVGEQTFDLIEKY